MTIRTIAACAFACTMTMFATFAPAGAAENVNPGTTYTPEQIRAIPLAGTHLGESEADAAKALTDGGFEGKFKPIDPLNINGDGLEARLGGWGKLNQAMYLSRYVDTDGTNKIGAIHFEQKFDSNQDVAVLAQKMIAKFGDPTEKDIRADSTTLVYRVKRVDDYAYIKDEVDICNQVSAQPGMESMCGHKYSDEQKAEVAREDRQPTFIIQIDNRDLAATARDSETSRAIVAAKKAAADQKAAEKAKADSNNANVGL